MQGLRVLLLGPPRLELDGQALTRLMPFKQQALVFHLAGEGRRLRRARLASLLWGELEEPAARANLRGALMRLRRWLPELLDIDAQEVGFAPGAPVWVDLLALERALGDPGLPEAERVAAARAWRGPLLDGFDAVAGDEFERWLVQARQRSSRAAVELRRDLMRRSIAEGRIDDAVEHAHGLLDVDDADEPTHMELMRLLAGRGQRIAAIAQYEACRAALAERLGARPSAECYALYARIHADTPAPSAGASFPASKPGTASAGEHDRDGAAQPAPDGLLFGRDVELALLRERLALPECRWLTVVGPGGVGKTRLALCAASELGPGFRHGTLWLSGRDPGGALRDVEALAQRVIDRVGADREKPGALLLVLDNLETVPHARALVQGVLARAPGVTGLATSRSRIGGSREWLLELRGLPLRREAPDDPASSTAARMLCASVRRLDPSFDVRRHGQHMEQICALVGGLPLALEMAARALYSGGPQAALQRLRGGMPLEDPDRDPDDRHQSIDIVLAESWTLLPAEAQQAAVRLALVPGAFDAPLAAALGVPEAGLDTLRAHSWLTLTDDGRLALHPLQQDYLRRRPEAGWFDAQVHEALVRHIGAALPAVEPFGDWIAADGDEDALCAEARRRAGTAACSAAVLAETARRLCAEGIADRLVPWVDGAVALLLCADRAVEAAAVLEAACARGDLPGWQITGWMLRRAEILNRVGSAGVAMRLYARAFARLGLGDAGADAPVHAGLPTALARMGSLHGWPPATAPAARDGYTRLVLRNLCCATQVFSFSPDPRPSVRLNLASQVLAVRAGDRALRMATRQLSAYGALLFGHPAAARWMMAGLSRRPAIRGAIRGDPVLEYFIREGSAATCIALGRWEGLAPVLDDAALRLAQFGHHRYAMECMSLVAKLHYYQGHLRAAWERFAQASELSLQRPGDAWRAWGPFGQAEVGLCLGNVPDDELRRLAERGAHWMTEMENMDSAYALRHLGLNARLAWRRGDAEGARRAVLAGVAAAARIRHCGFWAHEGYAGIGEVLVLLRAHERRNGGAVAALDQAWSSLDRSLAAHRRRFPAGAALVHRLRGLERLEAGRLPSARRELETAVRLAQAQGLRVELARSCEALASMGHPGADWGERARRQWSDMGARHGAPALASGMEVR